MRLPKQHQQSSPRVKNQALKAYFCLPFYLIKFLNLLGAATYEQDESQTNRASTFADIFVTNDQIVASAPLSKKSNRNRLANWGGYLKPTISTKIKKKVKQRSNSVNLHPRLKNLDNYSSQGGHAHTQSQHCLPHIQQRFASLKSSKQRQSAPVFELQTYKSLDSINDDSHIFSKPNDS